MSRYLLIHQSSQRSEMRFELEPGASYRVGAKHDNDLVIPNEDVSRHHAILRVGDGTFHITDLNSKNGTFVNGARVTDASVRCGDLIRLSSARLVVVEVSSGAYAMVPDAPCDLGVADDSSNDTSERTVEVATEELIGLFEDVADAVSRGALAAPLAWAVKNLGVDAAVLLYTDRHGGVSLLTSAGDLGPWATEATTLAGVIREHTPRGSAGSRIRHVSAMGDELLVCRITDEHVLVLGCRSSHPPVGDVRAVVVAMDLLVSANRASGSGNGPRAVVDQAPWGGSPDDVLVGVSSGIEAVRSRLAELASTIDPIALIGEPGVGKRSIAVALHRARTTRRGVLVEVDCHDGGRTVLRGSGDGAKAAEDDLWTAGRGGTVLLMGADRLPADTWRPVLERVEDPETDVCLMATWRGPLEGNDTLPSGMRRLRVPPLRERAEDIPLLVARWWGEGVATAWTSRCMEALVAYPWPDNLRELHAEVMRILAVRPPDRAVDLVDMAPRIRVGAATGGLDLHTLEGLSLADARRRFEEWFVNGALQASGGNQTRAAEELGLSRAGLFRTLRRLGMSDGRAD